MPAPASADIVIVDFQGPDDLRHPHNWSRWRKISMTLAVLCATTMVLSDGTLFTSAHQAIASKFDIDESNFANTYWPVTSWGVGAGLFAVFLLPLAEDVGVYRSFLASWALMIIFIIPQAVATNFATIVATRFFVGGFAGVISNSAVSVLVAIWPDKRIASPIVGLWVTSYLIGGSLGPVLGSAIFKFLDWRWTFYMQLCYYSIMLPIYAVVLKEVRIPAIHLSRARKLRRKGIDARTKQELDPRPSTDKGSHKLREIKEIVQRAIWMLCTEPVVLVASIWSAFMLGTLYIFTQSVEQVFEGIYGWTPIQAGFVQASIVIGEVLGVIGVLLNNYLYFASADRNAEEPGTPIPEARLYTAIPGGLLVTTGMFVYAWTTHASTSWLVPAVGLALSGCGAVMVVNALVDYIVDSYTLYAASAMGAMALGENMSIAFLPLATQSMYNNLGFHWASSLLAFVSLALTSISVLIVINGAQLRRRSPFIAQSYMTMYELQSRPGGENIVK